MTFASWLWFQPDAQGWFSGGKQAYRCGQCLYHSVPDTGHPHQPERVKNMAVALYAEGNSIKAISRVPGMKAGTVYSWVKKACQSQNLLWTTRLNAARRPGMPPTGVISFDETWSYA